MVKFLSCCCAFIGTASVVSAFGDFTDPWSHHHPTQEYNKNEEDHVTLETEAITFYDGDSSSFIRTSNSSPLDLLLCASGCHEAATTTTTASPILDHQEEEEEDEEDDEDDDGDDGANKMLSNVSVKRSQFITLHHGATHFVSSSIQVIGSYDDDNDKRKRKVSTWAKHRRNALLMTTPLSSSSSLVLGIRGGGAAAATLLHNEFARRLLVAALVTLLYEGLIGHLLEFLKIVMQTSPPGTSYVQVLHKIAGGAKGISGIYDGFVPWGVVQAIFKGGVFGFAHSVVLSYLKPLVTDGILPKQLALTLAGGIAGGVQGYVLSPTLLLKTRVMTSDAFRGEDSSNSNVSILQTTLLSFKIGYDVITEEGIFALMKGSNIFALKRVCDWASRYFFSDVFMHLLLKYISKTPSLTPMEMFVADMLGGTASTIVTLPLDVIVAKIQDAKKAGKKVSPWGLLYEEYNRGGWKGLLGSQMQGFEARLLHVCFTTLAMKTGTAIMYDFLYSTK